MDYQALILNKLLDKYERSRHYYGDASINRRVSLGFGKKFGSSDFHHYDPEQLEQKEAIHFVVSELERRGLVEVQWEKFEKGNILEKVYLNLGRLSEAYQLAGRIPKRDLIGQAAEELAEIKEQVRVSWLVDFIDAMLVEMRHTRDLPKYLPPEKEGFQLLLKTLKGLDEKGNNEMLERIFSRKYLGGSKVFESRVRRRVISIAKDFLLEGADLEDEAVLQYLGIIKTSEELLFAGPLVIELGRNTIDFSKFTFGASMNADMIKHFQPARLNVEKVMTIENKAVYHEYIRYADLSNQLAVYLGGFYSPIKRIFLEKIHAYVEQSKNNTLFYHWGDIDLGGLEIFLQLQQNIVPGLIPYKMDITTLRQYSSYGDALTKTYAVRLEKLLKDSKYTRFHALIREMLRLGIRLEQEALVI